MKNMMAMIEAIAGQTLKGVTEKHAVQAFTQRLHALSTAHDVLLRKSWSEGQLMDVVKAVLSQTADMDTISVTGPAVMLGPRAAMSVSLLLHEMATNAAKYGALSCEGGRIEINWIVEPDAHELVLTWKEVGGPPATEPSHIGFGTRLLRSGLLGIGGVNLCYSQSGLVVEMRASIDQVQAK